MILLIDNYDSFVYNLARYVEDLGEPVRVERNDALTVTDVAALDPRGIIISPGPGVPGAAGISVDLVRRLGGRIPILGVCLGHQCIAVAYGMKVRPARAPQHGKQAWVSHGGGGLFTGLPNPFRAGRYHSLVVDPASVYGDMVVTATSDDGEIMGLCHRRHPVWGVQFHPESVLTGYGYHILHRFLDPGRPVPEAVPVDSDWVMTGEWRG